MKKLAFMRLDVNDKYSKHHHLVDSHGNRIAIDPPHVVNFIQGLYLIDFRAFELQRSDYIGYATIVDDVNFTPAVDYLKKRYYDYTIPERAAVLRFCKGFTDALLDSQLDLEDSFIRAQSYMSKFSLDHYVDSAELKIYKSYKRENGFAAYILATSKDRELFRCWNDKYLSRLTSFYESSEYYDNEDGGAGSLSKHDEERFKAAITRDLIPFRIELRKRYDRRLHFNSVYERLLWKQRQDLQTKSYQLNREVHDYNRAKFPLHFDSYGKRLNYEF